MQPMLDLNAAACFSECGTYRYLLRRDIDMFGGRVVVSIGYNPSDADHSRDDPTIRREIGFCKAWGVSTLIKVNAFAAVTPYPADLAAMADPVGPLADDAIRMAAAFCAEHDGILIATWGTPKGSLKTRILAEQRFAAIHAMSLPLHAIRLTKGGYPEHPLYLPRELVPARWSA